MKDIEILVVEDEPSIREVVALYLERAGFITHCVEDGDAALKAIQEQSHDLVIMDLMLPGIDGLALTQYMRDRGDTPIIMLTARRDEADRIAGLEMGADDYVVKPFSPQELVSRVRAVLRRTHGNALQGGVKPVEFEALEIDPATRIVQVRGEEIELTAKEFDLLYHLASHPRQVFNRDQLLDRVWGMAEYIDPSTVTVHVRRLREKIEAHPSEPAWIQTVWGVGYKFEP
ncbi:MAG: response regulator transcription factor [Anaerolineales bacterium]|jgi:DNA-binding response OmpR family regulator